ncbi:MAG: hypothetical protein FWE38_04075 [Firmicutes bacterium]|nr:hypothetical protein [Bacillota bacterium]
MMKRSFVLLFGVMLSVALFWGGVTGITGLSAARNTETVIQPGVPYNYISSPRLLAADGGFLYVINQTHIVHLHIIDRETIADVTPPIQIPTALGMPLDIHVSHTHLFIFWWNGYLTFPTQTAREGTIDFTPALIPFSAGFNNPSSISTTWLTGTNFRVLYTSGNTYAYHIINASNPADRTEMNPTGQMDPRQSIMGITTDNAGQIHLHASSPLSHGENFFIYGQRDGGDTHIEINTDRHFFRVRDLTYIGGGFVFISDRSIVYLDLARSAYSVIQPTLTVDFQMRLSYEPITLTVDPVGNVLVIDWHKRSIDMYRVVNGALIFDSIAVGHRGQDQGFLNRPTAMTLIGPSEFLVADYSDSIKRVNRNSDIIPAPFIMHGAGGNAANVDAMAFDNRGLVFIYDRENRIQRFDLDAERVGGIITHTSDGGRFGNIVQLTANPATHEIFALDAIRNETIWIFRNGLFIPQNIGFAITPLTRAAIAPLTNTMFFINVRIGNTNNNHVAVNMTTWTHTALTLPTAATIRDITVDTLGNPIVIGTDNSNNGAFFHHTGTRTDIPNASFGGNPSLSFDRLNNTLYWIGLRHAVESLALTSSDDTAVWGLRYPHAWQHYDYTRPGPILAPSESNPLFMAVETIHSQAPQLFEFPASVNPLGEVAPGTIVQIITPRAIGNGVDFPYAYVRVGSSVGYINRKFLTHTTYSTTQNIFGTATNNTTNTGRVIVGGVLIFRYPTSTPMNSPVGWGITVGSELDRRAINDAGGLSIIRRITVPDGRQPTGWEFFEIRVDENGNPNTAGLYAGFVYTGHIIYFDEPPSTIILSPNARIILPSGYEFAQVYFDPLGANPQVDITLLHRQQIRVIGRLDRSRPFTRINFEDPDMGIRHGYVETRFIVTDTLTTWQLIGIIIAGVGVVAAAFFTIKHFRKKRAMA